MLKNALRLPAALSDLPRPDGGTAQAAETRLFAGGNGADVRKTAAGRFSN